MVLGEEAIYKEQVKVMTESQNLRGSFYKRLD